jgi:Icc-related predicted phosphoesterase
MARVWDKIPLETDILITHGPPYGYQDWVDRTDADRVGCRELLKRVELVRPTVHVFGHIHEAYGVAEDNGIQFVNASTCNGRYDPINEPILITLAREAGSWVVRYCGPASGEPHV